LVSGVAKLTISFDVDPKISLVGIILRCVLPRASALTSHVFCALTLSNRLDSTSLVCLQFVSGSWWSWLSCVCLGDHLFTVSFFLACLRFTDKSLCGGICLSYFYPMSCVDLLGTHPRNAALFEGPPPLDTRDLSVDWDTVIGKFFVLFIALGFGLQKRAVALASMRDVIFLEFLTSLLFVCCCCYLVCKGSWFWLFFCACSFAASILHFSDRFCIKFSAVSSFCCVCSLVRASGKSFFLINKKI